MFQSMLFCVHTSDRPGLRNLEQVERIQNRLTEALQNIINLNHKEDSTLFAKLLMKTTDLRTLNTLHSEKSIGEKKRATSSLYSLGRLCCLSVETVVGKKLIFNERLHAIKSFKVKFTWGRDHAIFHITGTSCVWAGVSSVSVLAFGVYSMPW